MIMRTVIVIFLLMDVIQNSEAISPATFIIHFIKQDEDHDGSSYEKAIIINETNTSDGVAAEYKWLRKHYPGYKFLRQALSPYKDKYYDILFIKYKGKKKAVYFDISNFFGKY